MLPFDLVVKFLKVDRRPANRLRASILHCRRSYVSNAEIASELHFSVGEGGHEGIGGPAKREISDLASHLDRRGGTGRLVAGTLERGEGISKPVPDGMLEVSRGFPSNMCLASMKFPSPGTR